MTIYDAGIPLPPEFFLAIADVAKRAILDAVSKPNSGKLGIRKQEVKDGVRRLTEAEENPNRVHLPRPVDKSNYRADDSHGQRIPAAFLCIQL